jgi:hypothetical protein
VFETAGLFDPGAITNEDAELNQRILASGGGIWLSPKIVVHYHPRDSYRALFQQYFRYGRGRARTLVKHGTLPSLRSMAPFGLVAAATAMLLSANPLFVPAVLGYCGVTMTEALRMGKRHGGPRLRSIWGVFPVIHIGHGVGFALGLVRYARRPDWTAPERLAPRPTSEA